MAYSLGITDVCPLKFDLLFERFLNPERVSMPDIDVDFCFERRGEVIEYVRQRYGRASVGQIVTFGTMKARAAVKDVARVLRIPPGEADRITKLIPSGPAYSLTIADAERKVDELRDLVKGNPAYRRLLDLSSRIEGISRHMSVHAAGVVIAPGPLADYVPVCTAPTRGAGAAADGEESIITQYEMGALEKVGMLKMDMLGLKTLTVIHDAVLMIAARAGVDIDMAALTFDDPKVYELLRQGRTAGVFQFESPLATDTLRAMKCDRFDDLVASNALLRPGPLDAGMHTVFIRRKLGLEKVTYPHPSLQEVLEPTYGVITYQEQVMRIANVLAGFTLAEADVLRKAVGKKDAELIKKELGKFCERAMALGHPEEDGGRDRGADRDLRPLRLQQVALGGLLGAVVPDRVAQGPLPGRVHGGAAVVGNRQHRQGGAVHQRGARARPRGAAAGRQRVGLQVHGGGRPSGSGSASAPSGTSAGAPSRASSPRGRTRRSRRWRTSSSASTSGSATSGCSSR